MTQKKKTSKRQADQQNQVSSSLHTEVSAEPELGDFRTTNQDVVATIELSEMHVMKLPPASHGHEQYAYEAAHAKKNIQQEATVAIIPAEDVLPMDQQEKLGGSA